MENIEEYKSQLREKYSINGEDGTVYYCRSARKLLRRLNNPHTLILTVGVQGAGKTTFCQKSLSEYARINIDEMLLDYVRTHNELVTPEINRELNILFYKRIGRALWFGSVIVEANFVSTKIRYNIINEFRESCNKIVLLVFNPPKSTIISHIRQDLVRRLRPGLWEDVDKEYDYLNFQIQNNILSIGVDEVIFIE